MGKKTDIKIAAAGPVWTAVNTPKKQNLAGMTGSGGHASESRKRPQQAARTESMPSPPNSPPSSAADQSNDSDSASALVKQADLLLKIAEDTLVSNADSLPLISAGLSPCWQNLLALTQYI